jgi:hypothetical protein
VPLGKAVQDTNHEWLPAGPASNIETTPIFTDQVAEFQNLQQGTPPGSGSSIDLTDQQLTPSLVTPLTSSANFLVTPALKEHGYFEIEFDLSNTFWTCNFSFGNSTCGINIRQGVAHLIDKSAFVTNDPNILNTAVAIDNPLPIDNGGLTTPSTCGWDILYVQTNKCIVGSTDPTLATYTGGSSFHLASAGSTSRGAQPNPSLDFCAAAGHFITAGVAANVVTPPVVAAGNWWTQQPSAWTISSSTNCVLTGVTAGTTPNFFIRKDDVRRLDLGDMLAGQICLLFTGSSVTPCANLTVSHGFITTFQGFLTSPTTLQNNWWIYTAAFISVYPYDSTLYFLYNSEFVSGFPSIQGTTAGHTCSPRSVGSFSAGNYPYLCDVNYDALSTQMEFANCPGGAPTAGSATPTFTTCSAGGLSALSAAFKVEDRFGKGAYTIPIMNSIDNFAYLNNGWLRAVNSGNGLPNFYTWLNAWNSASSTIRQGFKQTTRSLSPYIASTAWDFYVLGNVADSIGASNPYSSGQLLNYMTVSTNLLCNSASACTSALTYAAPSGTVATYRYTLRSDLFFHDGKQVTSFDVVFNYLSLLATGAFQSSGASPILSITVLSPTQFDFNINGNGPSTPLFLSGLTIMSSAYFASVGASAWNTAAASCASSAACFPAQYGINFGLIGANGVPTVVCDAGTGLTSCPFSANNMQVDGNKIGATYDPVASGTLIASGAWMCVSSTGVRGQGCSATGKQNPDPSTAGYTLTRFGTGHAPGSSLTDSYFRSSGTIALWFWSGNTGDFGKDFLNFGVVAKCVNAPLNTVGCTQWQQGIGGELNGSPTPVAPIPQASIVARFVGVDMVSVAADLVNGPNPTAPWTSTAIPMLAVGSANSFNGFPAPVLYEGTQTLNPASAATGGCASGYPAGGYDC